MGLSSFQRLREYKAQLDGTYPEKSTVTTGGQNTVETIRESMKATNDAISTANPGAAETVVEIADDYEHAHNPVISGQPQSRFIGSNEDATEFDPAASQHMVFQRHHREDQPTEHFGADKWAPSTSVDPGTDGSNEVLANPLPTPEPRTSVEVDPGEGPGVEPGVVYNVDAESPEAAAEERRASRRSARGRKKSQQAEEHSHGLDQPPPQTGVLTEPAEFSSAEGEKPYTAEPFENPEVQPVTPASVQVAADDGGKNEPVDVRPDEPPEVEPKVIEGEPVEPLSFEQPYNSMVAEPIDFPGQVVGTDGNGAKPAGEGEAESESAGPDLSEHADLDTTKDGLLEIAAREGVEARPAMRKADIQQAIIAARAGKK